TVGISDSRENEINSVYELLRSRMLVEKLIDSLGADTLLEKPVADIPEGSEQSIFKKLNPLASYGSPHAAIKNVQKRLTVTAAKRTSVITLFYQAQTPQKANEILTELLTIACAEHLRVNRTEGSLTFFAEQADRAKTELISLEQSLRELKDQAGWSSLDVA